MRGIINSRVLIVTVSLILAVFSAVLAEPGSVTASQREQLKSLAAEMRDKTRRVRDELMRGRMDLFAAYQSWDLNEQRVRQAISRISRAQSALLNLHLENQLALRRILNSEQFAELSRQVVRHWGHGHKGRFGPFEESPLDRLPDKAMLDAAGVSPEQARKILQFSDSPRRQAIIDRLQRYSKQLIDLFSSYDLDTATARRLIDKIHDCQSELLELNLEKQQVLRSVLTREQFEKLRIEMSKRFRMPAGGPRPGRPVGRR
ncbi:MAG: hypothetical protein QHI38_04475 [Armatimonadota bacterium]|nr:hypothetical protein [Armatimonadota bacterium]